MVTFSITLVSRTYITLGSMVNEWGLFLLAVLILVYVHGRPMLVGHLMDAYKSSFSAAG